MTYPLESFTQVRDHRTTKPSTQSARPIQTARPGQTARPNKANSSTTTVIVSPATIAIEDRRIGGVLKNYSASGETYVWMLGNRLGENENEGRWVKASKGEAEKYNNIDKPFYSSVIKFDNVKSYSSEYGKKKEIKLNNLHESLDWIHNPKKYRNLEGEPRKSNVYYFKNIGKNELTSITTAYDQILVTDTLHGPISFISTQRDISNYIKIIANCIVYENPIIFTSTVVIPEVTNYVISAKTIKFKTAYSDLEDSEIKIPPPLYTSDINFKVLKDPFGHDEILLLNRLFVNIMEEQITKLFNENDPWKRDHIAANFQFYRYEKVDANMLGKDSEFIEKYKSNCQTFNTEYPKNISEIRNLNKNPIFVFGERDQMHFQKLQYYALPQLAVLEPVMDTETGNLSKLGTIIFNETGNDELVLEISTKIYIDEEAFNGNQSSLSNKNITLQTVIPDSIFSLKSQPIVINSEFNGTASPISKDLVRLRINLPDDGKSLLELFPVNQGGSFFLKYTLRGQDESFNQKVELRLPTNLIVNTNNDKDRMLDYFNVYERSALSDNIKVSSQLNPYSEELGALQYVEFNLVLEFQGKNTKRGPFRLSSYSTLSSDVIIPFIKHSDSFRTIISGTAHYEDGTKDFEFENTNHGGIILLTESIFSKLN